MTTKQGKILVLATISVMTALLIRAAAGNGEWVGFAVTELQILVPMAIAWRLFTTGATGGPKRSPR